MTEILDLGDSDEEPLVSDSSTSAGRGNLVELRKS